MPVIDNPDAIVTTTMADVQAWFANEGIDTTGASMSLSIDLMGFVSSLDVDVAMTAQQITDFKNNFFNIHTLSGITAFAGGGQVSATLVNARINEVSTVASPGDSVKLPSASPDIEIKIINDGANSLDIFPNIGNDLGAGINVAISLESGSNIIYVSYDSTNWKSV